MNGQDSFLASLSPLASDRLIRKGSLSTRARRNSSGNVFKEISHAAPLQMETDNALAHATDGLSLGVSRSVSAHTTRKSSLPEQAFYHNSISSHSPSHLSSAHDDSLFSPRGREHSVTSSYTGRSAVQSNHGRHSNLDEQDAEYYKSLCLDSYLVPSISTATPVTPTSRSTSTGLEDSSALRYGIVRCDRTSATKHRHATPLKLKSAWREHVLVAINGLLFLYPFKQTDLQHRRAGNASGPYLYYNKRGVRDEDVAMRQFAVDTFNQTPTAVLALDARSRVQVSVGARAHVLRATGTCVRKTLFGEKREEDVAWLIEFDSADSMEGWRGFVETLI